MNRAAILLLVVVGCQPPDGDQPVAAISPAARQVVVVRPVGPVPNVTVALWSRVGDAWLLEAGPWPAVVGSAGVAPVPTKREGDKRTPAGVFPLGPAFGDSATIDTRLDYFRATADDYWIDDPASHDYNRRVTGPKPACSHEVLLRGDPFYQRSIVIGYNTAHPVAGRGSAIFLHVWRGPGQGTDGCVALAREHVDRLLSMLDRRKSPVIAVLHD
jgi:L,D-peptidoglycan transpeptidase YkuD (ErfK/YbiS/YcfS/YnhG family)